MFTGKLHEVKAQLRSPVLFLLAGTGGGGSGGNVPPIASIDSVSPSTGVGPIVISFEGSGTDANGDPITNSGDNKS